MGKKSWKVDRRSSFTYLTAWISLSALAVLGLLILTSSLSGCSATHAAINKRNLEVQTKMSASVFLDPVSTDKRTIYLQVRNTSDKPGLNLETTLADALICKGYTVVYAPEQAHFVLQANVLQVGKSDLRTADRALSQGFGAALSGGALGAGIASMGKNHEENTDRLLVGGLIGAAVSTVTDAVVQDVVYSVITDIQISERVGNSVIVQEKTKSKLIQGTTGTKVITSTEKVDWKRYQTRVVSTANKVNLKFEHALPELMQGLTHSISGVF